MPMTIRLIGYYGAVLKLVRWGQLCIKRTKGINSAVNTEFFSGVEFGEQKPPFSLSEENDDRRCAWAVIEPSYTGWEMETPYLGLRIPQTCLLQATSARNCRVHLTSE